MGFVDAPVSGSSPKAEDGTLTIMAGGAQADFERARPYFEAMGEKILHVGPLGHGQTVKVISNAVGATNAATLAQALVVGKASGVDLGALVDVLGASAAASTMVTLKAEPMVAHDYTPLFRLDHMLKDMGIALETSAAAGAPFPSAALARELYLAAQHRGPRRRGLRGGARGRRGPRRRAALTRRQQSDLVCQQNPLDLQGDYGFAVVCAYYVTVRQAAWMRRMFASRGSQVGRTLSLPDFHLCRSLSRNGPSRCAHSQRASSSSPSARGASVSPASTSRSTTSASSCTRRSTISGVTCVRESHQPEMRRALEEGVWADGEPPAHALGIDGGISQPDRVRIRAWAEVANAWTVTDRRSVDALSPFYVWTPDYAEKRLAWKRRHPLHVLLLRTYRIPRPVTVKVRDDHGGCRSWLEITRDLPFEGTPVLSDEEFDRASEEITSLIETGGVPAYA